MTPGKKSDHDLLIEIHTTMFYVKEKMGVICEDVAANTLDIDKMESWKDKVNGALGIIMIFMGGIGAKILKWI